MSTMSPLVRSFVAHFGEMGSRWGINRTVGQIYALIFVSPSPLNAEDIADKGAIARLQGVGRGREGEVIAVLNEILHRTQSPLLVVKRTVLIG